MTTGSLTIPFVLCFVCSYIPLIAREFGNDRLQGQTLTWKPLLVGLIVASILGINFVNARRPATP